ncbi:MAG TPA: penicillin acylase family protein, partial [Flavobacteriia bacterium]|nr:penicillin acylase family protein [Flavobacteriia bacterium]
MRILKKVLKILAVLSIIIVIGLFVFKKSLQPTYNGTLQLASLQDKVDVFYDNYGIPHIYAQNELDARRALGYVHAQDRLWQMELMRRLAAGRLSELFGEKLVRVDKLFSGLGIEEAAEKDIARLDKNAESYKLAMAYLDGINQFIDKGPTPIEYYILGIKKEKFTLKDMYNVFGYMAFSFAQAHKTDPLLTEVKEKLGNAYSQELEDIPLDKVTLIKNQKNEILEATFAEAVNEVYELLPISPFVGSNSWVIGPDKTKNGRVIFANDPHIAFSQPSVWYQSHIKTPDYEIYGYNLALIPFPLLGHNRRYAYGLTMFENDDIDFFFEEENPDNPNEYKTPNGLEKYQIRKKEIKVKGGQTLKYNIKVSRHGPLMNSIIDYIEDSRPIAMDWIYTKFQNKILETSYTLSHSSSLAEFEKGAAMIHAPGLNVMYGDADGNIAWFAAAKLYKYKNDVDTYLVLNGNSTDDQKDYLDFSDNPQAINPSLHYVYSANNQPDSIAGMLYPGYYLPQDRAQRIVNLLEAKNNFTKEDVMQMITDVTSDATPSIVTDAFKDINTQQFSKNEKEALQQLKNWDGSYHLNGVAPTIYNRFIYEFLAHTYRDEMGKLFGQFLNTHLQKKMIAIQMARENSVWWDDVTTLDKKESKQDIIGQSFKNAVSFLEQQLGNSVSDWTWNKVHTLEHKHPIGEVSLLRRFFNVGPFPINGANEVINNQLFNLDSTGYYKVLAGPSTRRVIDFSDVEKSVGILPTGQSGNPLSNHYKDQFE